MKKSSIVISLFFLLLFANVAISQTDYYVSGARQKNKIKPDFPFDIQLKSPEGKLINSADLFKKHKEPTVLLFWLTTCYPCRLEIAEIQKKYEQWKKEERFRLVLISYDFPQNFANFTKRAEEEKWPWEAYNDVNREFGQVLPGELNGLPQSFVFDKDGKIAYQKRKYTPGDEDNLFAKIKDLNKKN
ncbi:MAG: TlpA family protein disulfide reductase [Saprospiraceae bacterium]